MLYNKSDIISCLHTACLPYWLYSTITWPNEPSHTTDCRPAWNKCRLKVKALSPTYKYVYPTTSKPWFDIHSNRNRWSLGSSSGRPTARNPVSSTQRWTSVMQRAARGVLTPRTSHVEPSSTLPSYVLTPSVSLSFSWRPACQCAVKNARNPTFLAVISGVVHVRRCSRVDRSTVMNFGCYFPPSNIYPPPGMIKRCDRD